MSSTSSDARILQKIYEYPKDVLAGRIVACAKVRAACERFMRDIDRARHDPAFPWAFDERLAVRPSAFMEKFLRPTKGDYDSMELLPWECFVLGNIYGWVDKGTGLRRFREALIVVGRGNGKSTLMAGVSTYGACKDGERGADVYLLANSKEQAGIVFEECKKQIKASPALAPRFRTLRDGVYYDGNNATIKHRASDSRRLDGLNPHTAVFDEIHEFQDFKLINVVRRGMNKRRQPLALYITTMGNVLDGVLTSFYGIFTDAMTEGILSHAAADRMFAYICELDTDDNIEDTSCWIKANPSLGPLLPLETLVADWERCKQTPQERADFITKQLNVTADTSDAAYLPIEIIDRNTDVIDMEMLLGRCCYGGYDLSSREDFTSAVLLFPLDDGRYFILHHSWTTRRKVELNNEKIDYYNFAMLGVLTIVEGEYITQDDVFVWFKQMGEIYEILNIGYDPANAVWLTRKLEADGFATEVVRQGPLTLNDPMKDFREAMMSGRIVSNRDPMLRWYFHNVRLRQDYKDREKENWMPTKRNRYRKIDGFMATIDAWTVATRTQPVDGDAKQNAGVTVYSLRG